MIPLTSTTEAKPVTPRIEGMDVVDSIKLWFERAVPKPEPKNKTTQLGVHFEEIAEMIDELLTGVSPETKQDVFTLFQNVKAFADALKSGQIKINFENINRIKLLDAICDQQVTGVGVAHMLHMDMFEALKEVDDSNWSKFDKEGNPIFDQNRKIIKGPDYVRASLDKFV